LYVYFSGTYQLLAYADDVNLSEKNIKTMKKDTQLLQEARKEDGLEISMEEIKRAYAPVFLSRRQNVGEHHNTYILINTFKWWISLNICERQ
jgi:hypothetical protein